MGPEPKTGVYSKCFHWNNKVFYENRSVNKVATRWGKRMVEWYPTDRHPLRFDEKYRYAELDDWNDWACGATFTRL